jgi:hypothetical protein
LRHPEICNPLVSENGVSFCEDVDVIEDGSINDEIRHHAHLWRCVARPGCERNGDNYRRCDEKESTAKRRAVDLLS